MMLPGSSLWIWQALGRLPGRHLAAGDLVDAGRRVRRAGLDALLEGGGEGERLPRRARLAPVAASGDALT